MKESKKALNVINAYLTVVEVVVKTTRSYVNNPKFIKGVELVTEAATEAFDKHGNELSEAFANVKRAEEDTEENNEPVQ